MGCTGAVLLAILCLILTTEALSNTKKNVLFLVADDMRPELGAYYGPDFPTSVHPNMHTPNLDKLASKSLLLKRAYVQQAVCSPSRTSLLTGRRPDTTRVHDLQHYWRTVAGNFTTIPQYFKENGYRVAGHGKIFHPGIASNNNDPDSWNEPYFLPTLEHWAYEHTFSWYACNVTKTEQYPLIDQQTAQAAIQTMKRLAPGALSGEQPMFLAVGFHKPHLPFLFPENFLKYYPRESIKLPKNPYAPVGMPEVAWTDFSELRAYRDISTKYGYGGINTTLPDDVVIDLRRAYYAAITYTDSLVGQVIQALEDLGLANSTVISFWGDHGWQIGEHGEWCKHTNFELATHAPMMVHVPGLTDNGPVTESLTEFVDLFPSLAEAAGLPPVPLCPEDSRKVNTCTEGKSFVPLMRAPHKEWKSGAFSQYPRMLIDGNMVMGYTIRTDKYRYTEWRSYDDTLYAPIGTGEGDVELYDHVNDPDENINVAHQVKYKDIKLQLHKQLRQGWRKAMPPEA